LEKVSTVVSEYVAGARLTCPWQRW